MRHNTGYAGKWDISILAVFAGEPVPIYASSTPPPLGSFMDIPIQFGSQILGWTVLCDGPGTITFDLWRVDYDGWPPTVANSLTTVYPGTTAAAYADVQLTSGQANDVNVKGSGLRIVCTANDVVRQATVAIWCRR